MSRDILVGIDAGTSVIKAVAFTLHGRQLAVAALPNKYDTPAPGQVEQDMLRTWSDCAATLRELGDKVPNLPARVAAVAVTAQGDGTWLIDRAGEPVGGGLLWLDSRAGAIVEEAVKAPTYPAHYRLTGSGLNACMSSGQIAWLKQHQPERLARAATAFHCKDWLYFKLTGERATDPSEANFTFGNFRTRGYESGVLDGMGIGDCARLLPPIVDGTVQAASLSPEAAKLTGLTAGTPVVLAYIDVVCTALGSGIYEESGKVGVSILGSTGMHMRFVARSRDVRLNEDRSGYTMCMPVPHACAAMQSNMAATLNIDWLLDVAREAAAIAGSNISRSSLLAGMDERILSAAPAQAIYHPFIFEAGERGPFLDANARAQFSGLSTRANFGGLVRSVYEGLSFAAFDCYLASGSIPSEVRLGGGAARSSALRLILASALGAGVRTLTREETGAAGAAMIAAINLGLYPDMAACNREWVSPFLGPVTQPDPSLTGLYQELYGVYRAIREAMPPIWRRLAQIRQEYAA